MTSKHYLKLRCNLAVTSLVVARLRVFRYDKGQLWL